MFFRGVETTNQITFLIFLIECNHITSVNWMFLNPVGEVCRIHSHHLLLKSMFAFRAATPKNSMPHSFIIQLFQFTGPLMCTPMISHYSTNFWLLYKSTFCWWNPSFAGLGAVTSSAAPTRHWSVVEIWVFFEGVRWMKFGNVNGQIKIFPCYIWIQVAIWWIKNWGIPPMNFCGRHSYLTWSNQLEIDWFLGQHFGDLTSLNHPRIQDRRFHSVYLLGKLRWSNRNHDSLWYDVSNEEWPRTKDWTGLVQT